jgi:hypothetical protein
MGLHRCTPRAPPGPELVRILDWRTPGLGRYVIAATVTPPAGPFTTLTWPGYTGVLQASAPGRFAAGINQAPMPKTAGGLLPLDWLSNKIALWRQPDITPAHLLRNVFETATGFEDALATLTSNPIASPVIYSLAGCRPGQTAIIERPRDEARLHLGPRAAANIWANPDWTGHPRGKDNSGRKTQFENLSPGRTDTFDWLIPPALNPLTRLAATFSPADGRLLAQGFEAGRPATTLLNRSASPRRRPNW